MPVTIGLDRLIASDFAPLRGKTLALLCNQATVNASFQHMIDILLPGHESGKYRIGRVFGPEHGLWGHTQDNMIEWEGESDPRTGLLIQSLYGEHRKPTTAMLEGIDLFVADVPDVGSRYYTFVWTMAHCMETCAELGIPFLVLDRPNPIGGERTEGPILQPGLESFVGLYPVPTRHGLTAGEIAHFVQQNFLPGLELSVIQAEGWNRSEYGDQTGTPWALPSPNMPTVDTAVVYPGGCLFEATNLSEGRGTTRPFELVGAPYLDSWRFADGLNALQLPGVTFRAHPFEPTFNKHARTFCGGCFIHVTDRHTFQPLLVALAMLQETIRQAPNDFAWKEPPYEYVWDRSPFDILAGDYWIREAVENLTPLAEIRERMQASCDSFDSTRQTAIDANRA
jgi:uncharacterized protein YbbC (DUF1343 family)